MLDLEDQMVRERERARLAGQNDEEMSSKAPEADAVVITTLEQRLDAQRIRGEENEKSLRRKLKASEDKVEQLEKTNSLLVSDMKG